MSSSPIPPVQPKSYPHISLIPSDIRVDREGDCAMCHGQISDPVPEARDRCTECAQTMAGTPVSMSKAAVVVHPGAKGSDRFHLHCLRPYLITALDTPRCPHCSCPLDSSALLTRTETESSQFIKSAQRTIEAITRFVEETKPRIGRAFAQMHRGKSYSVVRAEVYLSIFGAIVTAGGSLYVPCRTLSRIWEGVFPVTGGEGLIVMIGLVAGFLMRQRYSKPPIDSAEYTIYPNASATLDTMETGTCTLCETPLRGRIQCEGSLTTHAGGAICDAAVVFRKTTQRADHLHLHCVRRHLHKTLLQGMYDVTYTFNKSIRKQLLTTAEIEIADRLCALHDRQTQDRCIEKHMPLLWKAGTVLGSVTILLTLWQGVAGIGSTATYVGWGISSLWVSWIGSGSVRYFRS